MEKKHASCIFPVLCLYCTEFIKHVVHLAFETEIFILQTCHCCRGLSNLCRKFHGYLTVLIIYHIQIIHHSLSTDHGQTDPLMEVFYCQDLDCANLTSMCHMCSATCTEVGARKTYQAHLSGQFLLASVIQFVQFFSGWVSNLYFTVFPDLTVRLYLNFSKLCLTQYAA